MNGALALLLVAAMSGCKPSEADGAFVTIDVKADYPEKEWVVQDLLDVEYIPLETNDEFVTQGSVKAIGKQFVLVTNFANDGDIFVFDRKTGKAVRKINRKGQGAEEYAYLNTIVLDEEKGEMFVNSTSAQKILVYDLQGNFKRSFKHAGDAQYWDLFEYDADHLIAYDMSSSHSDGGKRNKEFYHAILSKQDGRVVQGIPLPFETIKAPLARKDDMVAVAYARSITPGRGSWLLSDVSSDTAYCYVPGKNRLSPFIVKKPTDHPEVFFSLGVNTDRYCFMQAVKKEFNFEKGRGFPGIDLVYDKREGAVLKPSVHNADYTTKQFVDLFSRVGSGEIASYETLAADRLVEAYAKDELKGRLKEIAAGLDEESNPVLMLMKYRK